MRVVATVVHTVKRRWGDLEEDRGDVKSEQEREEKKKVEASITSLWKTRGVVAIVAYIISMN